ncbi:MAG: TIGR04282 family arsenosugar biosynthesis glycosyltransferase [Sulfuritalea sp.]|nr:TIGR04282 family arsenosugar biosynthesis glycosyltransferase [Sulfuritalea sp.]
MSATRSPEMFGRVGVAILARAPIPGEAKTRLIPKLGAGGAARLQAWMLQRAVKLALSADIGPVSLWCAGDPAHPDLALCRSFGAVTIRSQPQGDLGARMLTALQYAATPSGALVIGTDCPALNVGHLRDAAKTLSEKDAVAIPAEDGGYVLLGMKRISRKPFANIEWGSAQVMAQTRQRLAALGWHWSEAAELWDVDRPEDVERLLEMFPDQNWVRAGKREPA